MNKILTAICLTLLLALGILLATFTHWEDIATGGFGAINAFTQMGFGLIFHIITSLPLYLIAKKLKSKDAIWAFVPVFNVIVFFQIAQTPKFVQIAALLTAFLSSVHNTFIVSCLIILLFSCAEILIRLGRSKWESILLTIPFINIVYLLYLTIDLSSSAIRTNR